MNKKMLAKEFVKIAATLLGMEFDTEEALKKYKEEHDVKPGTKLTVKEKDEKSESKKDGPEEHSASFERFDISMTHDQAKSISQGGKDATEDVKELMKNPKIKEQLDKLDPDKVRAELDEYGAWDEEELKDDEENKMRILWIAGGNISEEVYQETKDNKPEQKAPKKSPKTPPHKKVTPTKNSISKVKDVMKANDIKDDSDELKELTGFKKTLGQRVPEKNRGKYYVRNEAKLKKDFIANMQASNYSSPEAFKNAQERIKKMPKGDFAKILSALTDEEE